MKKFETLGVIGIGAYGIVLKAQNRETNEIVAIKKFKESDSDQTIRKISLREAKILKIVDHPNIVHLKESFRRKEKQHLVFEYAEKTVLEVLEKTPTGISAELIRIYQFQLLKALRYQHKQDILHRDVKPENLLVNSDSTLKLCDFGFARKITEGQRLTDYVATRWYRSPELLLTDKYGKPSDIWAVGCIMGEQTDGKPLFPGKDQIDQLHLTMKVLGPLSPGQKELFNKNPDYSGINFPDSKRFQTLDARYKKKVEGKALSFLKGTLTMEPSDRLTAEECLQHPYFEDLRLRDPELVDLTNKYFENRIESTKCTDGGQDTRMTSSTTKNNAVNKIRIKTLNDGNPIIERKGPSQAQSVEKNPANQVVFSDQEINKNSKTYYNLHMQNSQFESTKLPSKQEKINKNYQVYNQFKQKEDETNTRQTIAQVKRQNMGRLQFDNSIGFENSNIKHNSNTNTGSLSQFQKKYNFTSTTKFASQDRKPNASQGLHAFKNTISNTNGFTKYDNQYGTHSFIKQLPTLNKKAFFSNSNAFPNNPETIQQYKETKKYPSQIKAQNISKSQMNDLHNMQIRRKQPGKSLNINTSSLNNKMNVSSNKFGFTPIMNNLF